MNGRIMSRKEATAARFPKYFTGKPCRYGHVAERYVSGVCVACAKVAWKNFQKQDQNREYCRAARRRYNKLPTPTRPPPDACESCDRPDKQTLCLDHDHETGSFRGWLCRRCNRGLGFFGDSIEGIKRILKYLERTETKYAKMLAS